MKEQIRIAIERLETYYAQHSAEISITDTFYFFDALAQIREAAGK